MRERRRTHDELVQAILEAVRDGPQPQPRVLEAAGIYPSNGDRHLSRLEADGLITREPPPDPSRRVVRLVRITQAGIEAHR